MIITLKGCTASASIGGLNFYSVSKGTVGGGVTVNITTSTISKDAATSTSARDIATVALNSGYENLVVTVTMDGTTVNWFANGKVTIPANTAVTGAIKISASATAISTGGGEVVDPEEPGTGGEVVDPEEPGAGGESGDTVIKELNIIWEVGSTSDDSTGSMGNKVNNIKRLRSSESIQGKYIKIEADPTLYCWYNIFNANGELVETSGTSRSLQQGYIYIDIESVGGTQFWPIFKNGIDGIVEITNEQKDSIKVYSWQAPSDSLISRDKMELGTFDDTSGEKVDNNERCRTIEKITVPTTSTGLKFIKLGQQDIWLKGYSKNDNNADCFNGIQNSAYWNTNNSANDTLTWGQISSKGRPAFINIVVRSTGSTGDNLLKALGSAYVAFTY